MSFNFKKTIFFVYFFNCLQNFNPVPVPEKKVGKFYTGDSYIVLKTRGVGTRILGWDLHYWLGKESSQDEAGAAALHAVGLDARLGGGAVHHREVQHHESSLFLSYFKPAIRYLQGGHESGFNEVETNAGAEKRMFQIRGTTNIRARQVEPSISSMNQSDCFILNMEHDIFVYVGSSARSSIKLKAIALANQIRDEDHNGRARIQVIDNYSDDDEIAEFFIALGSESASRDLIPEEADDEDEEDSESLEDNAIAMYEVSDRSGEIEVTELSGPYSQDQLLSTECYILDSINCGLYVWIGRECSQEARTEAMVQAEQYRQSKNYPSWVQLTRVPQGTEPTAFKQYFISWGEFGVGYDNFRFIRTPSDEDFYSEDLETSTKCAKSIAKTGSARGFMPDEGDGQVTVYRIEDESPVEVYSGDGSEEAADVELGTKFGQFYQGHAYVVRYHHGNGHIIYCWMGKDANDNDKLAAAAYADTLYDELEGDSTHITAPQGQEPKHFLKIFKGHMVTYLGGKASQFQKSNQKSSYDEDSTRMFKIVGTCLGVDARAEQVPEGADSLLDEDVFLLETRNKVYIWIGKESTEQEQQSSVEFAAAIFGDAEVEVIQQGDEPDDFWEALGGQVEEKGVVEWRKAVNRRIGLEPKLLEVSIKSKNGVTKVYLDEISDYKQEDLSSESVYVFDTWEEIYVWLGHDADESERKSVKAIIEMYLSRDSLWRSPTSAVVVKVKQGREPAPFKRMFGDWDDDMWTNKTSYNDIKARLNQDQEE